jgi:glutathione synthase/RimK-type ligase-like ATP-grasp enzyme
VPPSVNCRRPDEAVDFAARHRWPVVIKRPHGFAGQG